MIMICCCGTCSHYEDEMCTLETGRPIGTAPDDWCLGWKEIESDLHQEPQEERKEDGA